jgi:DNA-binding response OmpR family regulator
LLEYLMRNAGHRLTRSMIIEHVWNLTFDTTTNVVDVYINYSVHSMVNENIRAIFLFEGEPIVLSLEIHS